MSRTVYIYTLIDPRTNVPFHVGQTLNIKNRRNAHIGDVTNALRFGKWSSLKVNRSIQIVAECGRYHDLYVVDTCPEYEKHLRELEWIALYELHGHEILSMESPNHLELAKKYGRYFEYKPARDAYAAMVQGRRMKSVESYNQAMDVWNQIAAYYTDNRIIRGVANRRVQDCLRRIEAMAT